MNPVIIEAIKKIAQEELPHRFANVTRSFKEDGSFLTEADLAVQQRIQVLLKEQFPDVGFLGEEIIKPPWCMDT